MQPIKDCTLYEYHRVDMNIPDFSALIKSKVFNKSISTLCYSQGVTLFLRNAVKEVFYKD